MHWLQRLLVLVELLGYSHQQFLWQDPCDPANYVVLDEPHRSTGFKTDVPETPLCDMLLPEGWYRFNSTAGGRMPTTCQENLQCGTIAPIWMNGTHPTVTDGIVIREVCANLNTGRGHCCGRSRDIRVRNCGAFYVYYLYPTESCPWSYCAGEVAPCPVGKWSPTLFPPCIDAFPVMKSHPKLLGPNIHDSKSFDFLCQIDFADQDPDQRFEVSWLFDGQEDPTITAEILSDPSGVAILDGSKLKGHLNTNIECQVSSYYRGNEAHKSEHLRSNAYYAALEVNPPRLEFNPTESEKSVYLTSTVPIICDYQGVECCLNFLLDLDGQKYLSVILTTCIYKLCDVHWDYENSLATVQINVASRQMMVAQDSQLLLTFEKTLPLGGKYLDIFNEVKPSDVQIAMENTETFTCTATGDPHFTSFDGRKYILNLQGDFTAVQVPKRNFEVQVRTWACKNGNIPPATCICGVTVREGNELIRIDHCDQVFGGRTTSPKITTPRPLQEGTIVQRSADGKQIGVYLRSGAEIRFDTDPAVPTVHIILPSIDKDSATGICGTNDGNENNEFTYPDGHVDPQCDDCTPDRFMQAWRADTDQRPSLFMTVPDPLTVTTDTIYCSCQNDGIVCSGDQGWSTAACINQCLPPLPDVDPVGWSVNVRGLRYGDQCTNQCIQMPPEPDCGPWACNVKRGLIYEDADESDMASNFIRRQETCNSQQLLLPPDPCNPTNHIELDEPHRSAHFKIGDPETPLCDNQLDEGWYRFTSQTGGTIPTTCQQNYQCGTVGPVWMNGTLPQESDGEVERTVCVNLLSSDDHCCEKSREIKVRNCGSFYVYYLYPTPDCPVSYCAGDKAPCPADKWSPTLFPPCKDAFPIMKTPPALPGPIIINNRSFHFVCQINFTDNDPEQRFEVSWLFDGQEDPSLSPEILSDPARESILDGSKLAGHLNQNIECQVRSYYTGNQAHKSGYLRSNAYHAGMQASPARLVYAAQDSVKSISLTYTVPVVCDSSYKCCLQFLVDENGSDDVVIADKCMYELCTEDWDYKNSSASVEIKIVAKTMGFVQDVSDKQLLLSFEELLPDGGPYIDIFNSISRLNDVQIELKSRESYTCSASSGKHFTSFDGGKYNLYLLGDFTAVQVPKRNFEIQIRTWACNPASLIPMTCICGVTVREEDDLLRIDQCDQVFGGSTTSPKITTPNPLQEGTIVQRSADGRQIGIMNSPTLMDMWAQIVMTALNLQAAHQQILWKLGE